jgi:hypothetical protein
MNRQTLSIFVLLALSLAGVAAPATTTDSQAVGNGNAILEFKTMFAVSGPYVGPTNPIRGLPGGNARWTIVDGRGSLKADGKLEVKVRGLILPDPPFNGINSLADFRAVVNCQSIDANGNPTIVNVSTGLFPATITGDCDISETIPLPQPCVAPIIFIMHPAAGRWFATTGY